MLRIGKLGISGSRILSVGRGVSVGGGGGWRGPYDAIPSIAAAYGMRRLRSAYTGPILRIRRSSDDEEQDIGYTSAGDLDTAAIAAFIGAGSGFVTTWYDQSGNANHATQATAAAQPLYVASGQNGHPTASFDGSNDYLDTANFPVALAQPNMTVVVGKVNNLTTTNTFHHGKDASQRHALAITDTGKYYMLATGPIEGGTATTDWAVLATLYNGADSALWANGTQVLAGNVGTQPWGGLRIGSNVALTAFLDGSVAELVVVDSALSDTDRAAAETAANGYWNVF